MSERKGAPVSIKPPTTKPPTARAAPGGLLARLTSTRVQSGVLWVIIGLALLLAGLLVLLLALVLYLRLM